MLLGSEEEMLLLLWSCVINNKKRSTLMWYKEHNTKIKSSLVNYCINIHIYGWFINFHTLNVLKHHVAGFLIHFAWYNQNFCNPFHNQHTCGVSYLKNIAKSGICAPQFLPSSTSWLALCLSHSLSVYFHHSRETNHLVPAYECYFLQLIILNWSASEAVDGIGPEVRSTYWSSACQFEYLKMK